MHSPAVNMELKKTKLGQIFVGILKNSCNLHIQSLIFLLQFVFPDWVPLRVCYFIKVPYCSSLSTGKIWESVETYVTLQKTNWFLISSLLPLQFLLQHHSCIISTLGGFQEQTGYSPEQPGLASELLLLSEEVRALVRSLLNYSIVLSGVSFCLLSAVFQDFHYGLGTLLKRFCWLGRKLRYIAGKSYFWQICILSGFH